MTPFPPSPSDVAAGDEFGTVFGYKSKDDYWLEVGSYAAQKMRLYHVVNGSRGSVLKEANMAIVGGGTLWFEPVFTRDAVLVYNSAYTFADGLPSGYFGIYSNRAGVKFDFMEVFDQAQEPLRLGRWDGANSCGAQPAEIQKGDMPHV